MPPSRDSADALSHESLLSRIPRVLSAWNLKLEAGPYPVAGGTLNWNFDVRAGGARYFLRCYRADLETGRIEGEHALVRWAVERSVPAPSPIAMPGGRTLLLDEARRWALLPWLPGANIERGTLSARQARALGEAHGRLQAVLARHPDSDGATMTMRWDKAQSAMLLEELQRMAIERPAPRIVHEGLAKQRTLLETLEVAPPAAFASLPCQVLHGDFHDQQVLFEGDTVTAIVDWEIWHTDPRAWELVRSLAFSLILDSPLLEDYLAGYREHITLGEEEARLALRLWFQSRVVGVWAWWAYLKEGNERVAAFFPAMAAELDRVAGAGWREQLAERFVRAACG